MKEKLMNMGILVTFYLTIIFGVLLLNQKFSKLNSAQKDTIKSTYVAMNE